MTATPSRSKLLAPRDQGAAHRKHSDLDQIEQIERHGGSLTGVGEAEVGEPRLEADRTFEQNYRRADFDLEGMETT